MISQFITATGVFLQPKLAQLTRPTRHLFRSKLALSHWNLEGDTSGSCASFWVFFKDVKSASSSKMLSWKMSNSTSGHAINTSSTHHRNFRAFEGDC